MSEGKAKGLLYYGQLGAVITIFAGFLGWAYNYFQTTAAENFHYMIVIGIISYVIIATISYVITNKLFYSFGWYQFEEIAFLSPIILFIHAVLYLCPDIEPFSLSNIVNGIIELIIYFILSYFIIEILIYIFKIKFKNSRETLLGYKPIPDENEQVRIKILKFSIFLIIFIMIIIISMFSWSVLFIGLLNSPFQFQGNIMIDMENIYYKNDTQIQVLIHVTGPNTGLSIELLKEQSNNLSRIAYIDYLEPQHNPKISSNKSLGGYTLDFGKYNVLINTTNLTTGYYVLKCERPEYGGTYEGFYIY